MKDLRKEERKLTVAGGGSYYLTIPLSMIRKLGWRKGQKKTIRLQGKKIVIEDFTPQKEKTR